MTKESAEQWHRSLSKLSQELDIDLTQSKKKPIRTQRLIDAIACVGTLKAWIRILHGEWHTTKQFKVQAARFKALDKKTKKTRRKKNGKGKS